MNRQAASDEIVVQPGAERRPDAQDVRELADEFSNAFEHGVRVADPPRHEGVRVTWWELVDIWLPDELVQDTVLPAIIAECIRLFSEWARARMRRTLQEEETRQAPPQHLTIFGPDGKPLKTVTVHHKDEDADVNDPGKYDPERPRP